jgi:hypothetical protein
MELAEQPQGYVRRRKTYRLTFDSYPGLEVHMRSLTFGQLIEFGPLIDAFMSKATTPEQLGEIADWVARYFHAWNLLDEERQPVPATRESLLDEEFELFTAIVVGWSKSLTGMVAPPLPGGSANGRPSAEPRPDPAMEDSLPMTDPDGPSATGTESPQS